MAIVDSKSDDETMPSRMPEMEDFEGKSKGLNPMRSGLLEKSMWTVGTSLKSAWMDLSTVEV